MGVHLSYLSKCSLFSVVYGFLLVCLVLEICDHYPFVLHRLSEYSAFLFKKKKKKKKEEGAGGIQCHDPC